MIETIKLPVEHYLNLIKENKPFSLARYGDGEMILIFNHRSVEKRDIGNLQTAVEPMKNIFRNHYNYYHCALRCTFEEHTLNHFGIDIQQVYEFINESCPDMPFYDGEFWQDLSFGGEIEKLTTVLNPYEPVFIGGKHLINTQYINEINQIYNVIVDDRKAWDDYDTIKKKVIELIEYGYRMFCFSMGYPGKIMIDDLFPQFGNECFFIDFGSLWDPYCGVLSRSGMVTMGFKHFQPYTKYKLE